MDETWKQVVGAVVLVITTIISGRGLDAWLRWRKGNREIENEDVQSKHDYLDGRALAQVERLETRLDAQDKRIDALREAHMKCEEESAKIKLKLEASLIREDVLQKRLVAAEERIRTLEQATKDK